MLTNLCRERKITLKCNTKQLLHICHSIQPRTRISNTMMQAYLDTKGLKEFEKRPLNRYGFERGEDLQEEHTKRLNALLDKYSHVIAEYSNTCPAPMKNVTPHKFRQIDDPPPAKERCPSWAPAVAKFLAHWGKWAANEGLI